MVLPIIARFMIFFGTPITFFLMTIYLPLIVSPNSPPLIIFSCLIECVSTGIYCGCLIGLLFSRLFEFELGANWSDICWIRMFSSKPILLMHPVSLLFIDWMTLPAVTMTAAWLIAVIDWKLNWKLFAAANPPYPNDLEEPY